MSSDLDTGTSSVTQALHKKDKPSKKKSTSKSKSTPKPTTAVVAVAAGDHGKNEGDDPNWAYEPPEGAELLDHGGVDAGSFEWESIKEDEDVEIWLIRAPDSIKAKHLEAFEIDLPSSSSRTARIGSLTKKNMTYDVWSLGDGDDDDDDDAGEGHDTDVVGGEELSGLSCLLPRKKKKGKLYLAPKPVSRQIVISARPLVATAPEQQPIIHQNPPRPSYGTELLTHYFEPYGARSKQTSREHDDLSMDVDESETHATKPTAAAPSHEEKSKKPKESKGKKRKVEGESPKKSKKHKSND